MSRKRTVVGSWPHRQTLPEGREALERAMRLLAHYPRWGSVLELSAARHIGAHTITVSDCADWLPERYRDMPIAALREELRKLDEVAP